MDIIGKHRKTVRQSEPSISDGSDRRPWQGDSDVPLIYADLKSRAIFAVSQGSGRKRWKSERKAS